MKTLTLIIILIKILDFINNTYKIITMKYDFKILKEYMKIPEDISNKIFYVAMVLALILKIIVIGLFVYLYILL